ncbi:MAG: hypothetical protein AAF620_15270 [Bacteroidota bacterium]
MVTIQDENITNLMSEQKVTENAGQNKEKIDMEELFKELGLSVNIRSGKDGKALNMSNIERYEGVGVTLNHEKKHVQGGWRKPKVLREV